jgi:hypothetical protein
MKSQILTASILALLAGTAAATDISNNLSASTGGSESASSTRWLTASFVAGASGNTLNAITLKMANTSAGSAQLRIYSGASLEPQTLVGTLTSPTTYTSTIANNTFTTSGITLAANTTYWVVLAPTSGQFSWAWAADDSGTGTGFTHVWGVSQDAGTFWWTQDVYPTQMAVSVDCAAPAITTQPASSQSCANGSATFTVGTSATLPTYQWQAQVDGSAWSNLSNGNLVHNSITIATVSGATLPSITLSNLGAFNQDRSSLNLRAIVSASCGSASTSDPATLTVCAADFNCDGTTDFFDYLDFVAAFSTSAISADFNRDGIVDFFDYLDFVAAFSNGC